MSTNTFFAHNISELRFFFDMELHEVAKKLHVDINRYRHWEEGKVYPNSAHYYTEICKLYGYFDMFSLFNHKLNEKALLAYYEQDAGKGKGWLMEHIRNLVHQ